MAVAAVALALGLAACGSSDGGSEETTVKGSFELLSGAPAGYSGLNGGAELKRSGDGTTTSISVSGLEPESEYVAHLHTRGCEGPEPGGPHFKFDPQGGDEPPNEIHLEFRSDARGRGSATSTVKREVPVGEAGSVVLHTAGEEHAMAALLVHDEHEHGDDEAGSGGEEEHTGPRPLACAELEGSNAAASLPTIVIRDGEPVGGIKQLEYSAGEEIRFKVESDAAEEIHVHGYDVAKDVSAGGSVTFDIPAEIEGIFEAELEGLGVQIAEITVNP